MKEAAGEANMTVITIVLIAVVLAVGTLIVTNLMSNTGKSSACMSAGATWQGGKCYVDCSTGADGKTNCSGATSITCTKDNSGNWTCGGTN